MTTGQLKNSLPKSTGENIWTQKQTDLFNRAFRQYQRETGRQVCVQSTFLPFMTREYPNLLKKLKHVSDVNKDASANFRMALKGTVCKCCRLYFCSIDVCAKCWGTPKGRQVAARFRVAKAEVTNLKRWGATNPMLSSKGKKNHKKKVFEKLGVTNAMFLPSVQVKHQKSVKLSHSTPEYRDKIRKIRNAPGFMDKVVAKSKATSMERYGEDNPMKSKLGRLPWEKATRKWHTPDGKKETGKRSRLAIKAKYGVDNPFQSKEVQKKIKRTLISRYGFDHPMKNKTIRARAISNALESRFRRKQFKYRGKSFTYMGYEKPAIKECVRRYGVNSVKTSSEIPPIDLGVRLYFPDIYIEPKDVYIEVKSIWTMFRSRQVLFNCRKKAQEAIAEGYNLRWAVCSEEKLLSLLPKDWYVGKHSEVIKRVKALLPKVQRLQIKKFEKYWD